MKLTKEVARLLLVLIIVTTIISLIVYNPAGNRRREAGNRIELIKTIKHRQDSIAASAFIINGDKETTVHYNTLTGITVVQDDTMYRVHNDETATAIELAIETGAILKLHITKSPYMMSTLILE